MALVRNRPLLPDVVRSELRRAIVGGEFPPGSKLPNEEALCARFAVSRITLREAVRGLIEDGYVIRRQGAGTFVTSGPALRNSLDSNFSYTEYLESSGIKVSKKILDAQLVSGDDEVTADLDLGEDDSFVVIRRVRIAGKRPAIFSIDSLPADIAILIIEHDMDLVFRFAKRITVMVQGEVLCEGAPEEIAADRRVHEVYLGERHV